MDERNFCEYAVKKRQTPLFYAGAVCIALGVLALTLLGAAAAAKSNVGVLAFLIVCGGAGFLYYLSRYLSVEYEFTQTEDIFDVAVIYAKRYRREKLSVELRACAKMIAPYAGKAPKDAEGAKVYDFRASRDTADAYFIFFSRDGARGLILFDAAPRMIEHLFYQVPSVTVRPSNS